MGIEDNIRDVVEGIEDFGKFADYVEIHDRSLTKTSEEILELSPSEFSDYYFRLMRTLKYINGWWQKGNVPNCHECSQEISSVKGLRMYKGESYDVNCFKDVVVVDECSELMQKYWGLVLEL